MFISQKDAQFIVDEVKRTIRRDINIMDEKGVIIASTNPYRIDQVHEGAKKILQENLPELAIQEKSELEGVQQGVNVPICLHNETVGVIGITGDPKEVAVFGSVIKMMAEMMIERVWQTQQENQLETARSLFLENWIFSDSLEISELEVRGKLVGIDVSLPRFVILLQIEPDQNRLSTENTAQDIQNVRLLNLVRTHIEDNSQNFCAAVHQRILILLCEKKKDAVFQKLNAIRAEIEGFFPVIVYGGVSTVATNSMDMHLRYLEAKAAIRVASNTQAGGVAFYDSVSLDSVILTVAPEVKDNLVKMVFASSSAEEIEEMIQTIRLFFKFNGDIKRAAEESFIHKNTFQYRIQKVGKKTGYWLKNPRDAVMLYLVMQFYENGNQSGYT